MVTPDGLMDGSWIGDGWKLRYKGYPTLSFWFSLSRKLKDSSNLHCDCNRLIYVSLFSGILTGSCQTETAPATLATSAHQLPRALRRPWRLSMTLKDHTLAWGWGMEIMPSFSMVQNLQTFQEPKVEEMTWVQRRRDSMSAILTLYPLMKSTQGSMWGPKTSRAWMRTRPHLETIQIWTQTVRPWPGRVLCRTS